MPPNPSHPRGAGQPSKFSRPATEGKHHFFGIGINRYAHFKDLNNAVKDVQDMAELLTARYQFEPEQTTLLFDEAATRENIITQLDEYVDTLKETDSLLIYYSGHGHLNQRTERGFWIPTDAHPKRTAQYINNTVIKNYIEDIPTRHTLLVSDSCFSGALLVRGETNANLAFDEMEQRKSRWAFCSGRHDEHVYDGKPGKNSPFTSSILLVLQRNRDSRVNIFKIVDQVVKLTRTQYRQLPHGSPLFDAGDEGGSLFFI